MRLRQRLASPLHYHPHGWIIRLSPPELLLIGFILLSLLGTALLSLPSAAKVPLT